MNAFLIFSYIHDDTKRLLTKWYNTSVFSNFDRAIPSPLVVLREKSEQIGVERSGQNVHKEKDISGGISFSVRFSLGMVNQYHNFFYFQK